MHDFCKIVQDLLPNYMEKTTFDETNAFIEEHLEQCNECTKIYNDMTSNLGVHTTNIEKEVDYMKKFNKEVKYLKFLKNILIVILLILIGLAGVVLYRYSIFAKIYNLYEKNTNEITNIYSVQEFVDGDSTIISKTWIKDNLKFSVTTGKKSQDTISIWKDTKANEGYIIFENNTKYIRADNANIGGLPTKASFIESLISPDIKSRLKDAINPTISIENVEYDGKKCYKIKQEIQGYSYDRETIIDKQTGFPLYISEEGSKSNNQLTWSQRTIRSEYKINTVTDEDVAKPDLSQYEYIKSSHTDGVTGEVIED